MGACPTPGPGVSGQEADVHPCPAWLPLLCPCGFVSDYNENGMMAHWNGPSSGEGSLPLSQAACKTLGCLSPRCPKGYPEANKTAWNPASQTGQGVGDSPCHWSQSTERGGASSVVYQGDSQGCGRPKQARESSISVDL